MVNSKQGIPYYPLLLLTYVRHRPFLPNYVLRRAHVRTVSCFIYIPLGVYMHMHMYTRSDSFLSSTSVFSLQGIGSTCSMEYGVSDGERTEQRKEWRSPGRYSHIHRTHRQSIWISKSISTRPPHTVYPIDLNKRLFTHIIITINIMLFI